MERSEGKHSNICRVFDSLIQDYELKRAGVCFGPWFQSTQSIMVREAGVEARHVTADRDA